MTPEEMREERCRCGAPATYHVDGYAFACDAPDCRDRIADLYVDVDWRGTRVEPQLIERG